ncbi:MAG: efflux RND transporter periplasmic adaptor subunit [Bacteroidetes bacterium]|nr:efflux RND transporter periplasmic adaptor subunit [Bacteroidota bacterium]MBU1116207.1 efflux RND transporter periplasmic adaptor subunit [Bacteroidota bacterium]MBU1799881.1 efflux RND transporter periplasmic adaptor subunit [Bacteroidota bacterium]
MKTNKILTYLLIACTGYFLQSCSDGKTESTLNNTEIKVEVEQAKKINGSEAIAYSGTIEESESIPLSFSTIGSVSKVLVSEGDFVKKGQILAVINNESYKNAYEMSLATQKQAEDAYKRLLPMYKNGNLPEIKLVEVETGLQQAKSATLIAKKNLDDCNLYSPVDGVVGKRAIEPGMAAIPNLTSINIVKIEKVFARVPVAENEIASIKKGEKANITIAALNNAEFTGTVEEIGVMADPLAHTYKIKIGIVNRNYEMKPGMICNVLINKQNVASGLLVPSRAVLVDEKGNNFVYVVNQNKAVRKHVMTGRLLRNGVEVTSGLNEGEQIVVTGQQKLVDNSLIQIVKSN